LFEAEQADLLQDLSTLPQNGTIRKVNELVKRARLVKVHAIIISHLKNEMPSVFGKGTKQQELINGLAEEFTKLQRMYKIPAVYFSLSFFFFSYNMLFNELFSSSFSKIG